MTSKHQVAEASGQYLVEASGQTVPVGYKQTEVGMIPSDWDWCRLIDAVQKVIDNRGKTPPIKKDGEYELIETASISFVGMSPDYSKVTKYVSRETFESWFRAHPTKGDILVSTVGEYSGATAILNQLRGTIAQNLIALRFKPPLIADFVFYWTRSRSYKQQIEQVMMNQAQPSLRVPWLLGFKLPIPTQTEQTAIANALSDVDALIHSLEKLIAKKQAIKTATLQQLLTGRTRLPPFALRENGTPKGYKQSELGEIPEDWGICELQDAVEFLDGLRKPVKSGDRAKISGIYPYYGASGIVDYVNDYIFDDNLILLGEDGENILSRNLPLAFRVSGKIWVNNHAHVMKPKSNFDIGYLTDFLECLDYSLLNSGTAQPKLNKQACLKIKVVKPSKEEQTAIATILSDMDADIQTLQQRLSKTRQIKQGMMQELLTGKTRLL